MGYDLKMRLWRGDASGGDLGDYSVEVEEGEVVLDAIHRIQGRFEPDQDAEAIVVSGCGPAARIGMARRRILTP